MKVNASLHLQVLLHWKLHPCTCFAVEAYCNKVNNAEIAEGKYRTHDISASLQPKGLSFHFQWPRHCQYHWDQSHGP